jgi:hypothetical protein
VPQEWRPRYGEICGEQDVWGYGFRWPIGRRIAGEKKLILGLQIGLEDVLEGATGLVMLQKQTWIVGGGDPRCQVYGATIDLHCQKSWKVATRKHSVVEQGPLLAAGVAERKS